MSPIKILLIEDDGDDYVLTRGLLSRLSEGFVLDWAPTYEEAIELLNSREYDVCLADYRLGEHVGLELLNETILDLLPIIVLTGQDDSEVALLAMKAGASDYLVKGEFTASMLERAIRYSIERKRTHDELVHARDELDRLVLERTAELREANRALLQREADLHLAASRKDAFLAMLAHELRNPLAAIKNAIALAQRENAHAGGSWPLEILDRQTSHLVRLIDDLLDVSRITTGKIRLNRGIIEVSSLVDRAIEAIRPMIEARNLSLEVAMERGRIWLDFDPTRFEQVVQNLLSNAAKYSEEGGRIRLSVNRLDDEIVLAVKDEGIGISPEKLSEIFELFVQEDRSLERSQGGLGIGLTVVKRLVEMHGGSVSAKSEGIGRGSEFTIRIPEAKEPKEGVVRKRKTAEPSMPRNLRILVVDDNVDMTQATAQLLRLLGHHVTTAFDGFEALEAAKAHHPEFILLDIGLPGLDGFQVATRFRRDELTRDAVLIAISGYGQPTDRKRSEEAGFDHHLVKPIDLDELMMILAHSR